MRGQPVDALPNLAITMMKAADEIGVPYRTYATEADAHARGQMAASRAYGIDHVSGISDPAVEASDLGAAVIYREDAPPAIDDGEPLLRIPGSQPPCLELELLKGIMPSMNRGVFPRGDEQNASTGCHRPPCRQDLRAGRVEARPCEHRGLLELRTAWQPPSTRTSPDRCRQARLSARGNTARADVLYGAGDSTRADSCSAMPSATPAAGRGVAYL